MCKRQALISSVRQDQVTDAEKRPGTAGKINDHFLEPAALLIPSEHQVIASSSS